MRFCWVAVAAAFACGGTSSGTDTGDAGSGSGGSPDGGGNVTTFAVTLDVAGSGAVTTPSQTCTGHCVLQAPAGALHLVAVPSSGWHFNGWSGLCNAAACDLNVAGDVLLTAHFDQDAAVTPPSTATHDLSVTVNGPGRLVSSPLGIDCPGTCKATFDEGTNVLFTAISNSAAKFDGFSGACSGTSCTVKLGTDVAVSGTFEALIPVQHVLMVNIASGAGSVTSTPLGIDCPGACAAKFDEGTKVNLTTLNGSGMNFGGFSGACTGTSCTVTMASDLTVGVAFVPKPDPCAGLMPAIPAATSISVSQDSGTVSLTCTTGTSDGLGNLALLSTEATPSGPVNVYQHAGIYTLGDFGATQVNSLSTSTQDKFQIMSQVDGFSIIFGEEPFSSYKILYGFGPANTFAYSIGIDDGQGGNVKSDAVAALPGGNGTAVVRNYPLSGANNFVTTWQEYDNKGTPASLELQIGSGQSSLEAVQLLPTGHALIVARPAGGTARLAIWVNHGQLLTAWFKVSDEATSIGALDGATVLLRGVNATPLGVATDSFGQLSSVPAWLLARPAATGPFLFHAGTAYAMFATPHCPQLEVLTTSGVSCGCATVPEASKISSVGRDGSIIAPSGSASQGVCQFRVYPRALR